MKIVKSNFRNMCYLWVKAIREGQDYSNYKHVEMQIIKECPTFGLDPDDVFAELKEFADSSQMMEEIY